MPSFLNKVFGHKKNGDRESRPTREASDTSLLDGKYEAILPPPASTFPEAQSTRDTDRDLGFSLSLFSPKSRGVSQKSTQKHSEAVPHLTLQLPGTKENSDSRGLGVVFEADVASQTVLDDAVIAEKHLNPLEALILVQACAQAITERGLETLGIMHPHWFSASPDVQRKLTSLFIRSLTPQSRITTLTPTPTPPTSAFDNELHYTRLPHDVAAVLRWGLRHLSLENGHFGQDGAEWDWYNTFFRAERNASYPPKAFSELLLPQLPAPHIQLLTATLTLISSLASHAEANSISGSKLSKFLGLWLLATTRVEQSDDWNRFYARWERAGRILEHLFLARLREESLRQRLPTRLQELVNHYPYNKGSLSTEDGLLSRPRFSTRQYSALFVRVETLLTYNAEQPKQHPIRLLLEAFQLPVENPSGDEHIALWNALKTAAFEDATSFDPEGLQFTRIFVDETTQLLSLIPADSNVPTSPTFLASPITKVVSRKRSSSVTKVFEHAAPGSSVNNGSTPVSPTSPSSPVITDWAQFSLSGFTDATTQPLAALLSQEDDIEVTQPRNSRKSSRQRGKSRTRRRCSDGHEPLDTPPSSQSKLEPSIVETKLASVHVTHLDEAFIDFWSDAIVDPISASWPAFVVCGLKQSPGAEQPIHWLVIEQTYSRQQLQPPRVPSPDGRRGRSPRPSFRSDTSGFRINSMFLTARKRLSIFSKSATDLDPKKSGGKSTIPGELGEVLVEEEPTFLFDPTKADYHADGDAVAGATVTNGVTANVADQAKLDEISTVTVPITGVLSANLEPVLKAAEKVPSVEPTPQSGDKHNGFSVLPRSSSRTSKEIIPVEHGPPWAPDVVNPKVNAADSDANIAPLAADTSDPRYTQDTSDPTVLASMLSAAASNIVTEGVHTGIPTERLRQGIAVEVEDQLVALVTDGDERLTTNSTDGLCREVTEAVAMPSTPETVVVMPTPTVDDEVPEHIAEGPHVQSSQKTPADFVVASTVESVGQRDDLSLVSALVIQNETITSETGPQLEPVASAVDAVEEGEAITEHVEIPTPTPELVALVEETPGPDVSIDAHERAGTAQDPTDKPEDFDDAAPHTVTAELQANSEAEESFATHPIEASPAEIVPVFDTTAQVGAVETEHAADHVPELATEEAQLHVQDTIIQAAEAPLEAPPVPEISAGIYVAHVSEDVHLTEVETQAPPESLVSEVHVVKTRNPGAPLPVREKIALADEIPGSAVVEACEPVDVAPAVIPGLFVEDTVTLRTEPTPLTAEVQPSIEAELPTQVPALALSTESAALATTDRIASKAEDNQKSDDLTKDAKEHPAPESAPIEVIIQASKVAEVTSSVATIPKSEPVARDAQVLVEIEEPASESAPQSVDEATNRPVVVVPVPEEIITAKVEAQTHVEAGRSLVITEVSGEVVANQPVQVLAVEVDEASRVNGPEKAVDLSQQPVRPDIDVSTHEPAGL